MPQFANGGTRPKNVRENYVERLSYGRGLTPYMNKKREIFTSLNPSDDTDLAYRSTPNYLRQLAQQGSLSPTEMISARNIPRTKSASELTPRNNLNRSMSGNPKYKAQEDYYDEIQLLKKDMKTLKDENSNLRAKIRRLEEDNARKRKEIDALYDPSKDGDLRRTLAGSTTDRNTSNVVMSLKQRLFKLELQLKQKETAIDELKSDPRWTKGTELEIQNRALFGELERQKVERSNYIQNDYMASIDEEKKNALRKLNREKDELKEENESLKRKVRELEEFKHKEPLSARRSDSDKELLKKTEDHKQMKHELDQLQDKLDQANEKLEEIKRDRDQYRKKLEQAHENLEEIKHDRNQYKKKLDQANEEIERIKSHQTGRSSPVLKRHEEQNQNLSTSIKRPQSPIGEKRTPRSSTASVHRDSHSPEESRKPESKPTHSPPLTSKFDNLGSSTPKNRPSSASTSNESALKTVQASLRGHLNRGEVDKIPGQTPSKGRTTPIEKSEPIDSDREDDIIAKPSRRPASPYESGKKRDSVHDQLKPSSKQSLPTNKIGSNDRDLSSKIRRSPSPPADNQRLASPRVRSDSGPKQNLPADRNKLGSDNRFPKDDRTSSPKQRRSPSPPADRDRSSSQRASSGSGFKQNLPADRNKLDSDNRFSKDDRTSSPKQRRSPSPPADPDRSSSQRASSGSGFKQNLPTDRNKLGSDNRDSPSKLQRPSSPSNVRYPTPPSTAHRHPTPPPPAARRSTGRISPENPQPSSRKSPTTSKQSVKDTPNDDDDDDVIVRGS